MKGFESAGRPTLKRVRPSRSAHLAGREKRIELQIVAIYKFAFQSHGIAVTETAETVDVGRAGTIWNRYRNQIAVSGSHIEDAHVILDSFHRAFDNVPRSRRWRNRTRNS